MKNKKIQSYSIGIPTYIAGKSILKTLNSIVKQKEFNNVKEIIIAIDGNDKNNEYDYKKISRKIKTIFFKERKGQSQRLNDIFSLVTSNYLIITNDDVILDKNALKNIIICTKYKQDLISCKAVSLHSTNFLQSVLEIGKDINLLTSTMYNKGENYLYTNGRLIVLSKKLYKSIKIPTKMWNNDAFIYIYAKINNFNVEICKNCIVYYKNPLTFNEHIKQSTKFLYSYQENIKYFKKDISKYYKIPLKFKLKALIITLLKQPILTLCYLLVFFTTRCISLFKTYKTNTTGYWKTDLSTKL